MHPRRYANTTSRARSALGVLTAGAIAFGSAGCAPRTRRTPDDTLVVVVDSPINTADPRAQLSTYDSKLSKLVASGLTAVDTPSLEPRLDLASRIDHVDDHTVDITVRGDARFSDGSPVTAADVAGTYGSVLAADSTSSSHKMLSERLFSVEAIAPQVARFHLRMPLATFESDIDFGIISFHHGAPDAAHAIGAGPYQLRALTSDEVRLTANPYYFGEPPRLPNLTIKIVRDAAARLLMLVGGSVDLIQNSVRLDLVAAVRDRPRVRVESASGTILTYLMMNNEDKVLADRRVRQAIALAIDRPAIIAAKLGGLAVLATGLLPPKHWAYTGDVRRYDHDVALARRLLDEAGLRDPDGDGPAPRLHLVYKTSADAFRVAIARVIAAQLAEIGIDVEVRSFEFATFFADVKKGAYQLASMQTTDITDPDFYFMYFHSSWIPSPSVPDGFNRWRYRNAEVDRLTALGRQELSRDARKQIYAEVQRLVAEDVPIVALWHEDNVVLSNIDVQGYTMTPNARLGGLRNVTKLP
jgi:peptide/nickel transport system substrate-binding protein